MRSDSGVTENLLGCYALLYVNCTCAMCQAPTQTYLLDAHKYYLHSEPIGIMTRCMQCVHNCWTRLHWLCTTQLDLNLHKMYSSVLKYRLWQFWKFFIIFDPIYVWPKTPVATPKIEKKLILPTYWHPSLRIFLSKKIFSEHSCTPLISKKLIR